MLSVYLVIDIGFDVNEKLDAIAALLGTLEEIGFVVHTYLGGWGGKTRVSINGIPIDLERDIDAVVEEVIESVVVNVESGYIAASA